jgi:hypothetical protein
VARQRRTVIHCEGVAMTAFLMLSESSDLRATGNQQIGVLQPEP